MTDTNIKVREHYSAVGLTDRIKAALTTIAPESQALTVAQLAPLDQFHTRGILATEELARAAGLDTSTRVLDLGCGIGGPARYLAMNIADRAALYKEMRRILAQGGRFVTYDLVLRNGDVLYPVPWASDASASFLLTEGETRTALEEAGYNVVLWRDDTQLAQDWFKTVVGTQPQSGPNLGVVMGPDFSAMTGNLARNLRENRLGVLSAVLTRG